MTKKEQVDAITLELSTAPAIVSIVWKRLKYQDKVTISGLTHKIREYAKAVNNPEYGMTAEDLNAMIVNHPFDPWFDATGQYSELRDFILAAAESSTN